MPVFPAGGGWEESGKKLETPGTKRKREATKENRLRATRRAAARVKALCHCVKMRYFVTLTLDGTKIDRYDAKAIVKKMSQWCDNRVRKNGLSYILVPELHKDGAVHFHGFFNDALPVVDSGTISLPGGRKPRRPRSAAERERWLAKGGHVVYNLPSWTLGFTTALELYGDYQQAINYVCKYLSKQVDSGRIGGRWYYHGGNFGEYIDSFYEVTLPDVIAENQDGYYIFEIPEAGLVFGKKGWYMNGCGNFFGQNGG